MERYTATAHGRSESKNSDVFRARNKSVSLSPKRTIFSYDENRPVSTSCTRKVINPRYGARNSLGRCEITSAAPLHLSSVDSGHPRFARSISPPYENKNSLCLNLSSFDRRSPQYGYGRSLSPHDSPRSYNRGYVKSSLSEVDKHEHSDYQSWKLSPVFNTDLASCSLPISTQKVKSYSSPENFGRKNLSSEYGSGRADANLRGCGDNKVSDTSSSVLRWSSPSPVMSNRRSVTPVNSGRRQSPSPVPRDLWRHRSSPSHSSYSIGRQRSCSPRYKIVSDVNDTVLKGPEPCDQHLSQKRWKHIFDVSQSGSLFNC